MTTGIVNPNAIKPITTNDISNEVREYAYKRFAFSIEDLIYADFWFKEAIINHQSYGTESEIRDVIHQVFTEDSFEKPRRVIDILENENWVSQNYKNNQYYRIDTDIRIELEKNNNSFISYLENEIALTKEYQEKVCEQETKQAEIDRLTIKSLKKDIWQVKYWWLFAVVIPIITAVVIELVLMLIKDS